jgi:hypothetical protein
MRDAATLELAKATLDAVSDLRTRIGVFEQERAMRVAARAMLRESGNDHRSAEQVAHLVDEYVIRHWTGRIVEPEPPLDLSFIKVGDVLMIGDRRVVLTGSKSAPPTHDPEHRLARHAEHLRALEARMKRVEQRGAP